MKLHTLCSISLGVLPIVGTCNAFVIAIIIVELLLVGSILAGANHNFTFIVLVWLCSLLWEPVMRLLLLL